MIDRVLGRYPLSVVLSYLDECDGATALLLTCRKFAYQLLPVFRVLQLQNDDDPAVGGGGGRDDDLVVVVTAAAAAATSEEGELRQRPRCTRKRRRRFRHRYRVVPVQDPGVLLARLNTRRLRERCKWRHRRQQRQGRRCLRCGGARDVDDEADDGDRRQEEAPPPPPPLAAGRTTSELALDEYRSTRGRLYPDQQQQQQPEQRRSCCYRQYRQFPYPPELELLRYLGKTDEDFLGGVVPRRNDDGGASNCKYGDKGGGATLLVSYPRSGNSLARSLLERATGIVTGSDTRPDRVLSRQLSGRHRLVGEGVIDGRRVAFVKTHWPERRGHTPFWARRAVLLVRNPYDAIDSYWNMNATKSHDRTLTDDAYEKYRDKFDALVANEIGVWMRFHRYWLRDRQNFPVLVVRYEDLISDPERQVRRILRFALETGDDGGSGLPEYWSNRVAHVFRSAAAANATTVEKEDAFRKCECLGKKHGKRGDDQNEPEDDKRQRMMNNGTTALSDRLGTYKPRCNSSRAIGKSLRRYRDEQLRYIHSVAEELSDANGDNDNYLRQFGYDIYRDGFPDNHYDGGGGESDDNGKYFPYNRKGEDEGGISNNKSTSPLDSSATSPPCSRLLLVNDTTSPMVVRPVGCPFGRALREWRHSVTNNDAEPLPTL